MGKHDSHKTESAFCQPTGQAGNKASGCPRNTRKDTDSDFLLSEANTSNAFSMSFRELILRFLRGRFHVQASAPMAHFAAASFARFTRCRMTFDGMASCSTSVVPGPWAPVFVSFMLLNV